MTERINRPKARGVTPPKSGRSRDGRADERARRGPKRSSDGFSATIWVEERIGRARDRSRGVWRASVHKSGLSKAIPNAADFSALGVLSHPQRGRILTHLLGGPATYQALRQATKLKAGPLYHHINQLRLANLILPKERDLYELTRGGRNIILVAAAAASLGRDGRRRPVG